MIVKIFSVSLIDQQKSYQIYSILMMIPKLLGYCFEVITAGTEQTLFTALAGIYSV